MWNLGRLPYGKKPKKYAVPFPGGSRIIVVLTAAAIPCIELLVNKTPGVKAGGFLWGDKNYALVLSKGLLLINRSDWSVAQLSCFSSSKAAVSISSSDFTYTAFP